MKIPKTRKTYCPYCRKHTEHKVSESKRKTMGTAHPMSIGNRRKKRHTAVYGNAGRYSRPAGGKMYGKKQTKKTDLRLECTVCKKMHTQRKGFRIKKLEFV